MHREIPHTKPGSIFPEAGREASVVKIYVFPEIAYRPSLSYLASFSDTRGRILTNDPDPESPEAPAPSYTPQTPEKRPEASKKIELLKLVMLGGIWACFSSLDHRFGRHLVEMKRTDALHLPI